ncbi:uncharacterized protein PG986_008953 [Apiospora aurea]|uniref:Uncharacterized protein n=1 Tax=Apiospora aurea TaxID=335848 RepID=A0ABR1Q6C5_9PEZI
MELFLHNQDVEYLFVGGLPRSTGEAVRKNVLAFGYRGRARPTKGAPKVRKVSDPNRMHDVLKDWIGGGEEAKDFLLRLMAIAYDPRGFKERAQRTGLSAAEADSLMAQWFHVSADPVQFLQVLSFYLNSDTDLYFDWHQLHAFAEEIWRDITAVTDQSFECAPIAAFEALLEAEDAEKLAKRRGVDPDEFQRTNAPLLNAAWKSIQKLCAEGQGDICIAGIIERTKGTRHPYVFVAKQRDKLYKNWPRERRGERSAYQSLANILIDDEAARDEDTGDIATDEGPSNEDASQTETEDFAA